ncbi:MAG: sigma-70 family RNA polymerase sigma factor [Myxococcales bacterium]|nr:sigma-70 family RNA polymerase sigma factor [Myxococcales bacterium]
MEPARAGRPSLETLMIRYLHGDDGRVFAQLYRRVMPSVRRVIARRVSSAAAIDDLVQVAFMKAHVARARFEPERVRNDATVVAWYCAIARHVALDYIRKQARRRQREVLVQTAEQADALQMPDPEPTAEARQIEHEQRYGVIQHVRDAVALLPENQRSVIELHRFHGLTTAETAQRLQIRGGAVRVRAHRAYKALARLLASEGPAYAA